MDVGVRKGAALLDEVYPGWEHSIDLERLDLGDGYHCILGQLYGNFLNGVQSLVQIEDEMSFSGTSHGFNTTHEFDEQMGGMRFGFADLTRRWKRAIRRRLDN